VAKINTISQRCSGGDGQGIVADADGCDGGHNPGYRIQCSGSYNNKDFRYGPGQTFRLIVKYLTRVIAR
jgi:hypothetical protein